MQIEFGIATKYSFAFTCPPLAPMQIEFGMAAKHSFAKQSPKVRRDQIFFLHLHVPTRIGSIDANRIWDSYQTQFC